MKNTFFTRLERISPRMAMIGSFAGTSVINYLFGLIIGWLLVPGDYGLVGYAQTIILLGGLVLNSGFAWSITTQVANENGRSRDELVRGAFLANLLLSALFSLAIVVLFAIGPLRNGLENWTIVLIVVATMPFLSLLAIANGVVRGGQLFTSLAFVKILEVFIKAAAGIGLELAGFGVAGALAGFLLGSVMATAVGLWQVRYQMDIPLWGKVKMPSLQYAGPMFGALLGMAVLLNMDILFVKGMASDVRAVAGYYQSAIMLANTPYYLATAMFTVMFAQLAALKEIQRSQSVLLDTLRFLLVFLLPVELALTIAPAEILGLVFPEAYMPAAPFLQVLAVGNIFLIGVGMFSMAFQAVGLAAVPAHIFGLVLIGELIAQWLVVPRYGAQGAAIVFTVTCFAALALLVWAYRARVKVALSADERKWLQKFAVTLLVAMLAYTAVRVANLLFLEQVLITAVVYVGMALWLGIIPTPRFLQTIAWRKQRPVEQ